MSSDAPAIRIRGLGKVYPIYERPADRLWQLCAGLLRRLTGWRAAPRYREFHALRDVSLDVSRGETVGIIGRNGSGKSTLLQLLCGTLHPSHGRIEVAGRVAALLELGSGFNPEFTGRENIHLNASVLGLTRQQTEDRFDQIVAFADIGDFLDRPVKTYSSGMALRLAFAVIAHVDADILVIDEALAVGDAFFTQKCMRFLRDFMKHGTVLFVSHDIEAVKALCDRAIWLDQGRVRTDGPTKATCQAYLDALLLATAQIAPSEGAAAGPPASPALPAAVSAPVPDPRQALLDASTLRNDIEVFVFDPEAAGIGAGGCSIRNVWLEDARGQRLAVVVGGELVHLCIDVACQRALASPVIGFMVKDRTGQSLFGDNTWLSFMDRPVAAAPGAVLTARFVFEMPRLPSGDYTMVVVAADGTQADHVVHHWIHDALHFRSASSSVVSGLVGIPMRDIRLDAVSP